MSSDEKNFLRRQLPAIQKIIADETWLEGERRGCYVSPDDPVVKDHVCAVILRVGRELREAVARELGMSATGEAAVPSAGSDHQQAAA